MTRIERACLGVLMIIFAWFTWRGTTLFYGGAIYLLFAGAFTVTGVMAFFRFRIKPSGGGFLLVCLLSVLCMGFERERCG